MADLEDLTGYTTARIHRAYIAEARPRIQSPEDLYRLIAPYLADADREHFYGIYLTTKNHLLAVELISLGSLSASLVHPREIYKPAILRRFRLQRPGEPRSQPRAGCNAVHTSVNWRGGTRVR